MKKNMFNSNETALFDSVNNSCEKIENDLLSVYMAYLRNMKVLRMWDYADDINDLNKTLDEHKHALSALRFSIHECDVQAKYAEEIYAKIDGISGADLAMFGIHITMDAKNVVKRRIFATISKINTISTRLMLKEHELKTDISEIESRINELASRASQKK